MKRIELFEEGAGRTPFSAEAMNELVRAINALMGMEVVKGTSEFPQFHAEPSRVVLSLPKSASLGGGNGNVRYRGLWTSSTDYEIHDLVYVTTRESYIAEAASGPGKGGAHAPSYPEPTSGTIYWRMIAQRQSGGMTFCGEFTPTYPGDYKIGDMVVVRSGVNAGTFVCVKAGPNIASNPPAVPDAGGYWVSISPAAPVGEWI